MDDLEVIGQRLRSPDQKRSLVKKHILVSRNVPVRVPNFVHGISVDDLKLNFKGQGSWLRVTRVKVEGHIRSR